MVGFAFGLLGSVGAAVLLASAVELAPLQIPESILNAFDSVTREQVIESLDELQSSPQDAERSGRIGMLLHANGHYTLAAEFYRRAVKHAPEEFRWLYYLASALELDHRPDEAQSLYRRARKDAHGYIPLILKLADLDLDQGRWKESAQGYRDVLLQFPDLAVAHYGLGRSLAATGKTEEAVAHLSRACSLSENFGAAHYALARALISLGRRSQAERHLHLYRDFRLNRPVIVDGLMQEVEELRRGKQRALDLLSQGIAAGERGQLKESIELHRQAVELDPSLLQGYIHLILLYGKDGNGAAAEEVYRKASPLFAQSADLHYNLGVLRLQADQPLEAKKLFKQVLQINPLHPSANNNLGQILELEGRWEEAESYYREALRGDSSFRVARFNLARILLGRGQVDHAVQQLEQTVSPEDEETPRYLFALAAAWARKGDQQKVLEFSRQALEGARKYGLRRLEIAVEKELSHWKP